MLKSFKSQFHEGSSTSLSGILLARLERLGGISLENEAGSDGSSDAGGMAKPRLIGMSVCGGFKAGTRCHRNL